MNFGSTFGFVLDDTTRRVITYLSIVLTIALLAWTLRKAGKEAKVRAWLDLTRGVIQLSAASAVAYFMGVTSQPELIAIALALGLVLGWIQGQSLTLDLRDDIVHAKRVGLGVVVFAAGLVLMQGSGVANRLGLVRVGQAVSWCSVGLTIGMLIGRQPRIDRLRRRVRVPAAVAVFVLAASIVGVVVSSSPPAGAQVPVCDAHVPSGAHVLVEYSRDDGPQFGFRCNYSWGVGIGGAAITVDYGCRDAVQSRFDGRDNKISSTVALEHRTGNFTSFSGSFPVQERAFILASNAFITVVAHSNDGIFFSAGLEGVALNLLSAHGGGPVGCGETPAATTPPATGPATTPPAGPGTVTRTEVVTEDLPDGPPRVAELEQSTTSVQSGTGEIEDESPVEDIQADDLPADEGEEPADEEAGSGQDSSGEEEPTETAVASAAEQDRINELEQDSSGEGGDGIDPDDALEGAIAGVIAALVLGLVSAADAETLITRLLDAADNPPPPPPPILDEDGDPLPTNNGEVEGVPKGHVKLWGDWYPPDEARDLIEQERKRIDTREAETERTVQANQDRSLRHLRNRSAELQAEADEEAAANARAEQAWDELDKIRRTADRQGVYDVLDRIDLAVRPDGSIDPEVVAGLKRALRGHLWGETAHPTAYENPLQWVGEGATETWEGASNSLVVRVGAGVLSGGVSEAVFQGVGVANAVRAAAEEAVDNGTEYGFGHGLGTTAGFFADENLPVNTIKLSHRALQGQEVSMNEIGLAILGDAGAAFDLGEVGAKVHAGEFVPFRGGTVDAPIPKDPIYPPRPETTPDIPGRHPGPDGRYDITPESRPTGPAGPRYTGRRRRIPDDPPTPTSHPATSNPPPHTARPPIEPATPASRVEPDAPAPRIEPETPVSRVDADSPTPRSEPGPPTNRVEPEAPSRGAEPDIPASRVEPDSPAPHTEPGTPPARVEPDTPTSRGETTPRTDGESPARRPDGDTPGTRPDGDTPGTRPDGDTPGTRPDSDTPGTRPDGDTPGTRPDGDTPGTRPDGDTPGTRPDGDTPANPTYTGTDHPVPGPKNAEVARTWDDLGADGRGNIYNADGRLVGRVDPEGNVYGLRPVRPVEVIRGPNGRPTSFLDPSGRFIDLDGPNGRPVEVDIRPDGTKIVVGEVPSSRGRPPDLSPEVAARWDDVGAGPRGEIYGRDGRVVGRIDANGRMLDANGRPITATGNTIGGRIDSLTVENTSRGRIDGNGRRPEGAPDTITYDTNPPTPPPRVGADEIPLANDDFVRGMEPGTAVPNNHLHELGVNQHQVSSLAEVAHRGYTTPSGQRRSVRIGFRTTNPESLRHIRSGAAIPKPLEVKSKSIGALDVLLGADPDDVGKIGFFRPTMSLEEIRTMALPPGKEHLRTALENRWQTRAAEFADPYGDMAKKIGSGFLSVENGVVKAGPNFPDPAANGRPFAGDIDPAYIVDAQTGRPLTPEQYGEVVGQMQGSHAQIQHGAEQYSPQDLVDLGVPADKIDKLYNTLEGNQVSGAEINWEIGPDGIPVRGARLDSLNPESIPGPSHPPETRPPTPVTPVPKTPPASPPSPQTTPPTQIDQGRGPRNDQIRGGVLALDDREPTQPGTKENR